MSRGTVWIPGIHGRAHLGGQVQECPFEVAVFGDDVGACDAEQAQFRLLLGGYRSGPVAAHDQKGVRRTEFDQLPGEPAEGNCNRSADQELPIPKTGRKRAP